MQTKQPAKTILANLLRDAALEAERHAKMLSLDTFPNYGDWDDVKDHPAISEVRWEWNEWDELNNSINEWRYLSAVANNCEEVEVDVECKRLVQALEPIEAFVATVGDNANEFVYW